MFKKIDINCGAWNGSEFTLQFEIFSFHGVVSDRPEFSLNLLLIVKDESFQRHCEIGQKIIAPRRTLKQRGDLFLSGPNNKAVWYRK